MMKLRVRRHWPLSKKSVIVFVAVCFIMVSIAVTLYQRNTNLASIITRDTQKIAQILSRIDQECGIVGFDSQKNVINFLNVEKFSGSEAGSMNLRDPRNWKGPYLTDNLAVQGKEYMVVETEVGYFVTPGEGVKLPNGKVVGVDLALDYDADIVVMGGAHNSLNYKGKILYAPLHLKQQEVLPLPALDF